MRFKSATQRHGKPQLGTNTEQGATGGRLARGEGCGEQFLLQRKKMVMEEEEEATERWGERRKTD